MLVVALAFRCLLAVVLVGSGIAKVGRVAELGEVISRYRLVPEPLVAPATGVLPAGEILLGTLLATGLFASPVATAAACLFGVFAVAIAVNLRQGRRFECGCGLGPTREISWSRVGSNMVMVGLSVVVASEPPILSFSRQQVSGAPPSSQLAAVPLGVLLICVAVSLLRPLRETIWRRRRATGAPAFVQTSTRES